MRRCGDRHSQTVVPQVSTQTSTDLGVIANTVVEQFLSFAALDDEARVPCNCGRGRIVHAITEFEPVDPEIVMQEIDEAAQRRRYQTLAAGFSH